MEQNNPVTQTMALLNVKILPLREGFKMPEKSTKSAAAFDVFVPEEYELKQGRQIIPLGFACEMSNLISMDNRTRSGYAAGGLKCYDKNGKEYRINADVKLGLIDSDYRGEVGTIIQVNDPLLDMTKLYLKKHQAISQINFTYVPPVELMLAEKLSDTERGQKGFGEANGEGIR